MVTDFEHGFALRIRSQPTETLGCCIDQTHSFSGPAAVTLPDVRTGDEVR